MSSLPFFGAYGNLEILARMSNTVNDKSSFSGTSTPCTSNTKTTLYSCQNTGSFSTRYAQRVSTTPSEYGSVPKRR